MVVLPEPEGAENMMSFPSKNYLLRVLANKIRELVWK